MRDKSLSLGKNNQLLVKSALELYNPIMRLCQHF